MSRSTAAVLAAAILAIAILGGCSGNTATSSLPDETTGTTATVTTAVTTTTTAAETAPSVTTTATTTTTAAATTTTTTAAMTTVTIGKDDPDKDYGTPDLTITWDTQMAQEVLRLMNAARAREGVAPLTMDEGAMMEAAKARALDITVLFDHYRPNGDGFFSVFQQFGVDYSAAGENLAAGQPTAAIVFDSWWNSETHKANMLNASFTHVSIAAMTYNGEPYWVQLFRKPE